jgi:hypothetical protein
MIGGVHMNDVLFLIVALLILIFITGLKILIHVWGKKYRYKSTWELMDSDVTTNKERRRKVKRYGR